MATFFALLPVYILGNLHCIGMCGPLVLMLGRHRYRLFYFLGRTLSFTFAGGLAGGAGAVIHAFLQPWHIAALVSMLFGGTLVGAGIALIFNKEIPWHPRVEAVVGATSRSLSKLMLKDRPVPVFLFGFLTIMLPCGQTMIVYSAIALEGDGGSGLLNGLAFALFTSPSLLLAMRAQNLFARFKEASQVTLGACAILVGVLALCRGFAEAGWIAHLVLNEDYHIALY